MNVQTRNRTFKRFEVTCDLPLNTRDMEDMLYFMNKHNTKQFDDTFIIVATEDKLIAYCNGCDECARIPM